MRPLPLTTLALLAIATLSFACSQAQAGEPVTIAEGPVSVGDTGFQLDFERGQPNKLIDGVGWVIGVPNKLLLLDPRADNHDVSHETVGETLEFLAAKEVEGVKVRINQYDPIGEWRRLAENDRIGLGWRATIGAAYTLGYSVIPGRLFGGDWYNPFTDSVHVYSDVPALAMEQAAQAYDNHKRSHPGFYSAVRLLPFVGLVHEARSKEVVFEFVDETGTTEQKAEARRVLAPQMGRELGQAALFIPQGDALMSIGGAAVGHVVGRYQASQIEAAGRADKVVEASNEEPVATPAAAPTAATNTATTAPTTASPSPVMGPAFVAPQNGAPNYRTPNSKASSYREATPVDAPLVATPAPPLHEAYGETLGQPVVGPSFGPLYGTLVPPAATPARGEPTLRRLPR